MARVLPFRAAATRLTGQGALTAIRTSTLMTSTPAPPPGVPRHWDEELGGLRWLPRLIDKARMRIRGNLGAYLLGNSPVDRALLKRLNLTTDQFTNIVADNPTDEGVLEAIREHGMDYPAARRWSEVFHKTYKNLIPLWSIDEGYVTPKPWQRVALGAFKKIEAPAMALFRKISPAP
jgi:hypothetical protein